MRTTDGPRCCCDVSVVLSVLSKAALQVLCRHQWRRQAWGTRARTSPLEFANDRKFIVCSVERDIVQQIDIERVVDRFDALAQNRRLALK